MTHSLVFLDPFLFLSCSMMNLYPNPKSNKRNSTTALRLSEPFLFFYFVFLFFWSAASGKQPELFMVENQGNWILIKQWSSKLYHVIYSVIGRFYHLNYLIFEKKKFFPFLLVKEFFLINFYQSWILYTSRILIRIWPIYLST